MFIANSRQATTFSAAALPAFATGHARKESAPSVGPASFAWTGLPRCTDDTLDSTRTVPVALLPLVLRVPDKHDVIRSAKQLEVAQRAGVVNPEEVAQALSAPYPAYKSNTCNLAMSVFSRLDDRFCEINHAVQNRFSGLDEAFDVFNIGEQYVFTDEAPGIMLYMSQGIMVDFSQLAYEPEPIRSLMCTACELYEPLFPHFGLGDLWDDMSLILEEKSGEAKTIIQTIDDELNGPVNDDYFFFSGETPAELRDQAEDYLHALNSQKPNWITECRDSTEQEQSRISLANKIIQQCNEQPDSFWVNQARKLAQAFVDQFPTEETLNRLLELRLTAVEDDDQDEMPLYWGIVFTTGSEIESDYLFEQYEVRGNNGESPTLCLQWGEHPEHLPELVDNLAWASGILAGLATTILTHNS